MVVDRPMVLGMMGLNQRPRVVRAVDHLRAEQIRGPIYLITQFYLSPYPARQKEICYTLRRNLSLGLFHHIYLMCERRRYSAKELGLQGTGTGLLGQGTGLLGTEFEGRVTQVVLPQRMTYKDAFALVSREALHGYVVVANSDIFFDTTVQQLRRSALAHTRSFYVNLRFEYKEEGNLMACPLFGAHKARAQPLAGSQDSWMFHSKFAPTGKMLEQTKFPLGKPGCDVALNHILWHQGYTLYNEPYLVRTYHVHASQVRTYTANEQLALPYLSVQPVVRLTKAKAEPKKEAKAEPKKDAKAEPKKEAKAEPKKALSRPAVVFALAPIKLRQKEKYN